MTQTLTTTEELKHLASSDNANELTRRLARELLANLEAQPVASKCDQDVYANGTSACLVVIPKETAEVICRGISAVTGCKVDWHYTGRRVHIKAIALPAPALPDDYQHLKNVQELYHKQEDRLFSLAQRIKGASFDKYSHVPSQAVDVLEREIFGEDGDACRAAMLAQPVNGGYKLTADWRLDESTGAKILMYKDCSVIEDQQAEYVLSLIQAAAPEGGN